MYMVSQSANLRFIAKQTLFVTAFANFLSGVGSKELHRIAE